MNDIMRTGKMTPARLGVSFFLCIFLFDVITSINGIAVKNLEYPNVMNSIAEITKFQNDNQDNGIGLNLLYDNGPTLKRKKCEVNEEGDFNFLRDVSSSTESLLELTSEYPFDYIITEHNEGLSSNISYPKCDEFEDEDCIIDHNSTCIGEEQYCTLSYHDYKKMLFDYIYPTTPEWILICSHLVVFVMGLVGNALVCIAVYTNQTMRTVTNIFIVNLAVADFFVILFCLPPTVVWDVTETWFMGKVMCKIVLYFQTVSVTVSVLTLTFISYDRWRTICYPLRYKPKTERAWRLIVLIWIIGLLSDIPEFLYLTTTRKPLRFKFELFTQCVATWKQDTEKTFYIIKLIVLYIIPLLFMTVAYFRIVRILWKSDTIPGHRESKTYRKFVQRRRSQTNSAPNPTTHAQLKARRKACKMLVVVVFIFALCYMPVHALNIARYTISMEQSDVIAVLSLFSHWLCYANSAVNPVIYNFMSGKFRREFRNAFDKCRCFRRSHAQDKRFKCEERSLYQKPTKKVRPNIKSNYQFTSVRDMTGVSHPVVETSFNDDDHVVDFHDEALKTKNVTCTSTVGMNGASPGTSGITTANYNADKTALSLSPCNPINCSTNSVTKVTNTNSPGLDSCTNNLNLNLAVYSSLQNRNGASIDPSTIILPKFSITCITTTTTNSLDTGDEDSLNTICGNQTVDERISDEVLEDSNAIDEVQMNTNMENEIIKKDPNVGNGVNSSGEQNTHTCDIRNTG